MSKLSSPRRALRIFVARERGGGLLNPYVLVVSLVVLALERRDPVERPTPTPALANDLSWWAIQGLGSALGIAMLKPEAGRVVDESSGAVRPRPRPRLTGPIRALIDVLAIDFVRWAVHVARHRSRFLWRFHETHHETTDLNQFSAYRVHPVDHLLSVALAAVPLRMIGTGSHDLLRHQVLVAALGRTHHAAIDSDWPMLNKILVSPRAHRVHHSAHTDEFDSNYGVTFIIWDRLFGTYRSPGARPSPTGRDTGAVTLSKVPGAVINQLVAPLKPRDSVPTANQEVPGSRISWSSRRVSTS